MEQLDQWVDQERNYLISEVQTFWHNSVMAMGLFFTVKKIYNSNELAD